MKKNKKTLFYLLPFIVISLLLLMVWGTSQQVETTNLQGRALPAINLPMLLSTDGRFTSKALQGKVCLLNIWASWCPACQAEHSTLMAIKEHYSVPIYGINFKDNVDAAQMWLKQAGNPYTLIGVDVNGTITAELGIDGIPETFLLDKNGRIRYRLRGSFDLATWKNTLLPLIKQLINEQ